MSKWKTLLAVVLTAGVCTRATAQAQQAGERSASQPAALTALDYLEIQQLVNRYAHAIDTCADNGYEYARLYTPDGVYISQNGDRWEGPDKLAEVSCKRRLNVSHLIMNLVIDPSPAGATGKCYLVLVTGQGAQQRFERLGVGYEDVYVKTAQGWRFKSRHHVPAPPAAAAPNRQAPSAPAAPPQ